MCVSVRIRTESTRPPPTMQAAQGKTAVTLLMELETYEAECDAKVAAGTMTEDKANKRKAIAEKVCTAQCAALEAEAKAANKTARYKAPQQTTEPLDSDTKEGAKAWGPFKEGACAAYSTASIARHAVKLFDVYEATDPPDKHTARSKPMGAGVPGRGVLHWEWESGKCIMMKQVIHTPDSEEADAGNVVVTEYQIFAKVRIACIARVSRAYRVRISYIHDTLMNPRYAHRYVYDTCMTRA